MDDRQDEKKLPETGSKEFVFMREEIKSRPINRHKIMKNSLIAAISAVVFGLVACVTFVVVFPLLSKGLNSNTSSSPKVVVSFPEETIDEEMKPQDMLTDSVETDEIDMSRFSTLSEEDIRQIIASRKFTVTDYQELYSNLGGLAEETARAVVKVTSLRQDMNWINDYYEESNIASGLIVANNGESLLILTYYNKVASADSIIVTFKNNIQAKAEFVKNDEATGLCIISVSLNSINEVTKSTIRLANLGSSFSAYLTGGLILAVGSPTGIYGSVSYGVVTSISNRIYTTDKNYKLVQTDIYGSQNATGFLVTTTGYVVGVISSGIADNDAESRLCAIGITELKATIERMSNEKGTPYFGIKGTEVPDEVTFTYGVPQGAYVTSVELDSPAMRAGIQVGDIIFKVGNSVVESFDDFSTALKNEKLTDPIKVKVYRAVKENYKELDLTVSVIVR